MRKSYIISLLIPAVAMSVASCDDNAWNDKLDGFDGEESITDVQTISYTLTDADYALIASNSDNIALAGEANLAALKAVGTQHYFTDEITAAEYAPAFLASSSFPYFTLSDGSAIKLTYNVAEAMPEEITALEAASKYTLTSEDYQLYVWGSDDNYVDCFAPSKPANKLIPKVLADYYDDAAAGEYVIVTYQVSDQEPVFVTVEEPGSQYTHTLAKEMANGTFVMLADGNAATALAETKSYGYFGVTEATTDGKGLNMPEDATTCDFTFTATDGGYYIQDCYGRYVYQSAKYNSFNFSASLPASGAVWEVSFNADGSAKIYNPEAGKYIQYDPSYTSYGSYSDDRGVAPSLYMKVTAAKAPVAEAPAAQVPYTTAISVWAYSGSSWSQPSDVVVLQPADYTEMQQKYTNLSNNLPDELLPIFLAKKYPYAQADDAKFVLYQYYNGSATNYRCDQYTYDGTAWVKNKGVTEVTDQFVRNAGKWQFDPSVTITLPVGKGQTLSATYYQACVDWVYYNIDVPLGSTSIKSGLYYVTSYGNNEYYSGTSAYQNNVDLRASAAIQQYPAGYEGMTDDQIVELMKHRFAYEVFPGALKTLHADAVPVPGIDVLYTFTFGVYTGANATYTIVYRVVGPAEFEFVSCDWWEGGVPQQ